MAGFPKPNYTQTPNVLFDQMMPDMGDAELRVVLAVVRQTMGWHRDRSRLSLSGLMRMTGLSRQGVINGIGAAIERGVIDREQAGQGFTYGLLVNDVDQREVQLVNEVDQSLVNDVDHIKERPLKKTKRRSAAIAAPRQPTAQQALFEAVADACGLDTDLMNMADKSNVGALASKLRKRGVEPEYVAKCAHQWPTQFPSRTPSDVTPPSVAQLATWIGRCLKTDAAPRLTF